MPDPLISLLPLDDRPCNRLFPEQLAPIAGCELLMPPPELLGWFTTPGDCDAVADWVRRCHTGRLVISLDMLCYGGLVAGRTSAASEQAALARLDGLRALRAQRRDATIFAFTNLMRLGCTVTSPETLRLHQDLVAYSMLADGAERLGDDGARTQLEEVRDCIPSGVLDDYLAVRRRNHAINRAAIKLVAEGVLDYLVICQEDAAPAGLHIPEQQTLRDDIAQLAVAERVALHPGADEVGLVLMSRHVAQAAGHPPRIALDYASAPGADLIPLYEHEPLRQSAPSQLRASGAEIVPPGQADAILFLHTPIIEQREASDAPPEGQSPACALQADSVAARLQAAKAAGYVVALADVAYANGADPELVAALDRYGVVKDLDAFSAWNTAGNTIGTVAAQLCLEVLTARTGQQNPAASAIFLACRLLDDWAYQSQVRKRAVALAESQGENPYALGPAAERFEQCVRTELEPFGHRIHSWLETARVGTPPALSEVTLPWKRLFEIEARALCSPV